MMMDLLILMWEFFKTGLFAVGGGLATIPFLRQISINYGFFDLDTLSMMIGISESTPGPMGINMATYVGFETAGVLGAIVTTLSLVAPSIIVICIIAKYLKEFKQLKLVKEIFGGIKPAVIAFIIAAVFDLYISTLFMVNNDYGFNIMRIIVFVILLVIYNVKDKMHPIFILLMAAICGMIFGF